MTKHLFLSPAIFAGLLAASALAAPVKPAPRPAAPARVSSSEPLDLLLLEAEKRARLSYSKPQSGTIDALFDGNRHSSVELAPVEGACFAQVVFDKPRSIDAAELLPGPAGCRWSLAAGDSEADLVAKKGSYRVLAGLRWAPGEHPARLELEEPRAFRAYRLECRPNSGEAPVTLCEWSLIARQELSRLDVEPLSKRVARGDLLQLRALGRFEGGGRQNVTLNTAWEVQPPERGRIDAQGRFEALSAGEARVVARYGGVRSEFLPVSVLPEGLPDLDVTSIERLPHGGLESPEGTLTPGKAVSWYGHIKNYGTATAEPVPMEWRVDGQRIRFGQTPKVERFNQTEAVLTLPWDGKRHEIELVLGSAGDANPANNRLSVYSDARSAGFWVEEGAVRYFNQHQAELGVGSTSWEDWAQRQVRFWNRWMETGAWFWKMPESSGERWRLDQIRIVGDGMLPMAGGSARREPDRRDRTLDLTCGFTAAAVTRRRMYARTTGATMDNPFYYQADLLQDLMRARRSR